jgi:transcriptional regulator with XRE-family HTH domain
MGAKIQERRAALSLTIGELARDLGCTELELSAHEAGHQRIKPDRLVHLCRLLDAELSDIFEGFVAAKMADSPRSTATIIDLESRRKPRCAE